MALENERPKPPTTTPVAVQFVIFPNININFHSANSLSHPHMGHIYSSCRGHGRIFAYQNDEGGWWTDISIFNPGNWVECECGWPEAVINNREWISSFNSQKWGSLLQPCLAIHLPQLHRLIPVKRPEKVLILGWATTRPLDDYWMSSSKEKWFI